MSARILIEDDSPAVRRGLRHLLGKNPDWETCGEAIDGLDAVDKAQHLTPDLIVLDYFMPKPNGVEAARELAKLVSGVPILMETPYLSRQLIVDARKAGIRGAISTIDVERHLVSAIGALLRNETFFPCAD
jgi:DNA-binding NarL/FixJ family response regulator